MDRVVIAGAGLAGLHAAEILRRLGYDGAVIIVGDEQSRPYDRPPLSKQLLAGAMTDEECLLPCDDLDVEWLLGAAAIRLHEQTKRVELADGTAVEYDGLVIATGRRARGLPLPTLDGIHTLRTMRDAVDLRAALRRARNVVIVGAGFIGCEVAATTAATTDAAVVVVDLAHRPLPVVPDAIGVLVSEAHEQHGVRFCLGRRIANLLGDERVEGVIVDSGERFDVDVLLVAVGSIPNTEWLEGTSIELDRGCVAVDAGCFATADGSIVAAGDVAAWPSAESVGSRLMLEHWTNAREMARVAATNLLQGPGRAERYGGIPSFWSDQYDLKIKSVGEIGAADTFVTTVEDQTKRRLVVEALRGERLVGAVIVNSASAYASYQRQLKDLAQPISLEASCPA